MSYLPKHLADGSVLELDATTPTGLTDESWRFICVWAQRGAKRQFGRLPPNEIDELADFSVYLLYLRLSTIKECVVNAENPAGFVHSVLQYQFRNAYRRLFAPSNRQVPWDDAVAEEVALKGADTVEEESLIGVREAVAKLTYEERCALIGREIEERTFEELAAEGNLSIPQAKLLLDRARTKFKRMWPRP